MKKKIILVGGRRRAGKDTVCDILVDQFNNSSNNFNKFSFAHAVKRSSSFISDISVDELNNLKNDESGFIIDLNVIINRFKTDVMNTYLRYSKYINATKTELLNNLENWNENIPIKDRIDDNLVNIDARNFLVYVAETYKDLYNDSEAWGKILFKEINNVSGNIVISDFRFMHEINTFIENCDENTIIKTVKIKGLDKEHNDNYDNAISETELNDYKFNYIVDNQQHKNYSHITDQLGKLIKVIEREENDK